MDKLTVQTKKGIHVIEFRDILFMEKDRKIIIVHTRHGDITFYGKFSDISSLLDERFMWCHRSFVINMDKIVWMMDQEIYLTGNLHLHMGSHTFRRAKQTFSCYLAAKIEESENPHEKKQ